LSTRHLYSGIGDFGTDVDIATRALGVERFACVGMSGGGPYALACAAHLPERVVAGAVLGGVVPTCGPDAPPGGALGFARRFAPLLEAAHVPLALVLHAGIRAAMPLRSLAFDLCMAVSPEGDKRVFSNPGIKTMFLDDIVQATRRHAHSPVFDAVLFMRDWGFALGDIRVPIRFWHGDADPLVPLAHAQHMVERVADAELRVRPGESHLAAFDLAAEVIDALLALWPGEAAAVSAPTGSAGSGTARVAAPAART
jgi:pimeloyl-ACP methyl ester carboxylesterase